ncbi:MAG: hypothetical protein KBD01_07040 [Acidobacteria bacterium]|nr:hypothetical protein [Acidobacteriota bacterium]
MSLRRLQLLACSRADGGTALACPGPGYVRWSRLAGEILVPGSRAGVLRRLEREYELVVPDGASGQLREVALEHPWSACEHGQVLAVLGAAELAHAGAASAGGAERETPASLWEVRSPTHGTFYRRPAPGTPAYVEPGGSVSAGDTLALVEVMKCFSPILFEPRSGATRGIVREVLAADGAEVRADQPLMRIELAP